MYEPKIKIDVTRDVHEALRDRKEKGQTFNDVLREVLKDDEAVKQYQSDYLENLLGDSLESSLEGSLD